jgi:hypothetical protein
MPAEMPAGASTAVTVRVMNRGAQAWPAFNGYGKLSAQRLVVVVVRWLDGGQPVSGAGDVLRLPHNLAPGESVSIPLRLIAPTRPGQYEVEIRPAQSLDAARGITSDDPWHAPVRVQRGDRPHSKDYTPKKSTV